MSTQTTLTSGDVVARRYRLERTLGSGATAVVWAARDLDLGRPVAVKLVADRDADPTHRSRVEREAELLGRIRHPNLVRVLASGTEDGRPFLVMELLEGRSLVERLQHEGRLGAEDATRIAAGVAAGLGAVHAAGVVHRDVKPGNIVLDERNEPRLVDFGIARSATLTDLTRTDVVIGTASYLSPEQAQARPLDGRSDVYSLGCVLHEMLAGQPPFDGPSGVVVAYRHIKDAPPALSTLVADVPPELEAMVLRCLAKDAADRYADGGALAADLLALLDGRQPAAVTDRRQTTVLPALTPEGGAGEATTVTPPVKPTETLPAAATEASEPSTSGPGTAAAAAAPSHPPVSSGAGPGSQRAGRPLPPATWAAVGAVLVMVVLGAMVLAARSPDGVASVPDVTGMTYDEASARVSSEGFRPARLDQETAGAEPGSVVDMSPPAGTEIDEGATVTLVVAVAPPPAPAPAPAASGSGEKEDDEGDDKHGEKEGKDDGKQGQGRD